MEGAVIIICLVLGFGAFVWFLSGIQRRANSRVCPSCNKLVSQVDPVCGVCGYDFRILTDQFGKDKPPPKDV